MTGTVIGAGILLVILGNMSNMPGTIVSVLFFLSYFPFYIKGILSILIVENGYFFRKNINTFNYLCFFYHRNT